MSVLNDFIEGRLRRVHADPREARIVARVGTVLVPGQDSATVVAAAIAATRDTYKAEGKNPGVFAMRERAFRDAAAVATVSPTVMADMPGGQDKTEHFFVSGFAALKVAKWADVVLPKAWAAWVGGKVSMGIGYAKEVYDHFFATGYNEQDLAADRAGVRAALKGIE